MACDSNDKHSSTDPEVKQSVVLFASNTQDSEEPNSKVLKILQHFSSWTRLKKFVAWCIWCQLKGRPLDIKYITVEEMKKAEEEILKCVQKDVLKEELVTLKQKENKSVKKSSSLLKFDPILVDGLLRVGGGLNKAPINPDAKNPVILPKQSAIVDLIIKHCHIMLGHSGREHVLAILRDPYWIIHGNSMVRKVLTKCLSCKR